MPPSSDPRLSQPDRLSAQPTGPQAMDLPRSGPASGVPVTRLRQVPPAAATEPLIAPAARPTAPPPLRPAAKAATPAAPLIHPAPVAPMMAAAAPVAASPAAATAEPDTLVPTQWLRAEDDYLDGRTDIGRAMGNHTRELFVSCEPGQALQQQFEHLRPSYIALHDLACLASRHLLHAVAAAAGQAVQRLVIRRQGFGTTLAVLDYVDCPSEDGASVRLYATDADEADSAARQALARVLLCRATLAVVMVGDVPPHALAEQLQPLRQALYSTDWECARLVFMPLAAPPVAALTNLAKALGAGTGVHTQVGSVATRPADAWTMLSTAWNEQQAQVGQPGIVMNRLPASATAPGVMRPMPATPASAQPARPRQALERFIAELMHQPGVLAACLFDLATSKVLAHAGDAHPGTDLARRGTLLVTAANTSRKQLGLPDATEELLVNGGEQSLGLRRLGSHPGLVLHLVYRPAQASWSQLRPKVMALDAALSHNPIS